MDESIAHYQGKETPAVISTLCDEDKKWIKETFQKIVAEVLHIEGWKEELKKEDK